MRTRSACLLLVGVLLGSALLEGTTVAEAIPELILEYDYSQNIEKFFGKAIFVADQFALLILETIDVNYPTFLASFTILSAFILIRFETEKIKFYNIQKIVSFVFAIILVSSSVITPFSYSVLYWDDAFGQQDPLPVEETIVSPEGNSSSTTFSDEQSPTIITNNFTTTFDENQILIGNSTNELEHNTDTKTLQTNQTISIEETFILYDNATISLHNYTENPSINLNHTISLNEVFSLMDNIEPFGIPQNYSTALLENLSFFYEVLPKLNGTTQSNLYEDITILDDISLQLNNQTILPIIPPKTEDTYNKLFTKSFVSDNISSRFTGGSTLPNATESWQFENNTDNADLIGDAEIDYTEGINGTSLALDGYNDFAQTVPTNATTYITDMAISAWVKPNYTNGSPEFSVVSKGKSFVLSINNIIDPQRIAKFTIFDGIKWKTIESHSTIPDDSWTHLTARFNEAILELYVNGTLESSAQHDGVAYVTESGQIELKTVQEITSYYDIVIGASITPNMESNAYNMFSGMIDGVQLFDSKLEPEDVTKLYLNTVPIKVADPEPEPIDISEPSLIFTILNTTELELPVLIPAEDLNNDLNQLTVSTWIDPNYTGGSPEFTILGKENSFVLALNKMIWPERVAKFSVYDGISWHTVTGSTPINDWSHVAATINGTNISLYVNGTLEGRLDSGPSVVSGSTTDVVMGAYENKLRTESKLSNFFSGVIQQAEVYKYGMVDRDILDSFQYYLEEYQPENDLPGGKYLAIALNETLQVIDSKGIPNEEGLLVELSQDIVNATNIDDSINNLPIDSEIRKLFKIVKEKGTVDVIIQINTEFIFQAKLPNQTAIEKQLDDIENSQSKLLQYLAQYNMSLNHKFKNIPSIAITVDKNSLVRLLNSTLVKSVQEDAEFFPTLYSSVPLIGGANVHSLGFTGTSQTVAILDTGVEATHSFFTGRVVEEACFSTNDPPNSRTSLCPNGMDTQTGPGSADPNVRCTAVSGCDHGTHVAGIAAGWSDGTFPVGPGVANDANIIAVQVFRQYNNQIDCNNDPAQTPCVKTPWSDLIAGLDWVYDQRGNYDIAAVNLSLGDGSENNVACDGHPVKPSIDLLRAAGIATIISSGNEAHTDGIAAPACVSSAISVGSTTVDSWGTGLPDDAVSAFSNSDEILDLLAPGQWIYSSVLGDIFNFKAGTSMAAPHVTGAWALLMEKYPTLSVDDALLRFTNNGKDITDIRNGVVKPRIDLLAALNPFSVDSDSASVADSISSVSSFSRTIKDSASIDDTISAATFIPITTEDSSSVDDTISVVSSLSRTLPDSSSVDDTISVVSSLSRTLPDSSSVGDTISVSFVRSIQDDSSSVDDSISVSFVRGTEKDSSSVDDTISTTSSLSRTIPDSPSVDDTISTTSSLSRTIPDSSSVDDTISVATFIAVTTEDSSSVDDTISTTSSLSRTLPDSSSVDDTISTTSSLSRTIPDSSSVDDTITAVFFIPVKTKDSASIGDFISSSLSSLPPSSPPPLPPPDEESVKKSGAGATGAGMSAGIGSPASSPGGGSPGGGISKPESEDILEEEKYNLRTPNLEPDKDESKAPEPTTEPDDVPEKETESDMSDFIQQIKNIQLIMIIASISVVIAIFLVRARGILFS